MRKYKSKDFSRGKKSTYPQIVIDKMTEIVEKKMENMRAMFPIMLTIITSLLVYLFTTNFFQDALWMGYLIIAYLLVAFCSILMALYPQNYYEEYSLLGNSKNKVGILRKKFLRRLNLSIEFSPWNVKSYLKLSDEDFLSELENFCDTKLNDEELLQAHFLKQKINELYFKKDRLFISCSIIIGGALVLAISFIILFFNGVNGI